MLSMPSFSSLTHHRSTQITGSGAARWVAVTVFATVLVASLGLAVPSAEAQLFSQNQYGVLDVEVDGNSLTASLELPGNIQADLEIRFESVVGLTESSLGLSLDTISLLDLGLLNRLQLGSILNGFPLLLTVDPASTSPLSFTGAYEIHLHTENLPYTAGTMLRLVKAADGLNFRDITDRVGQGSYRVRGTSGGFSVFLIALETRSSSQIIEDKYADLRGYLQTHSSAMPQDVYDDLVELIDESELDGYDQDDFPLAIEALDDLIEEVADAADDGDIPNVWRASRDLENVAGELTAMARTTRFSLLVAP